MRIRMCISYVIQISSPFGVLYIWILFQNASSQLCFIFPPAYLQLIIIQTGTQIDTDRQTGRARARERAGRKGWTEGRNQHQSEKTKKSQKETIKQERKQGRDEKWKQNQSSKRNRQRNEIGRSQKQKPWTKRQDPFRLSTMTSTTNQLLFKSVNRSI